MTDRRRFLKTSLLAGATGAAGVSSVVPPARAQKGESSASTADVPTQARAQRETAVLSDEGGHGADGAHVAAPGSDFMVDLLRAADIRYVAAMPGSTFRGLQESIVTYGDNKAPELISCVHEEISAAICHGYAKVAGKPMACLVHATVGLQHA